MGKKSFPESPQSTFSFRALRKILTKIKSVTILLSGGVDSAALAWASGEILPSSWVHLLTFSSPLIEPEEVSLAAEVARQLHLPWHCLDVPVLDAEEVQKNHPRRCYACRKRMHALARKWCEKNNWGVLADGVHGEDRREYRPGLEAAEEDHILHPLEEAGCTKEELRQWVAWAGLPHWNRPPMPCVATRFPSGVPLDIDNLAMVQAGEVALRERGFPAGRIRFFPPGAALVEVPPEDMSRAFEHREALARVLKNLGFKVVALDMEGYCRGKMERFH